MPTGRKRKKTTTKLLRQYSSNTTQIPKMPPQLPPGKPTNKFYFFYGHRKPSQNRPTVHGGLFTNRQTRNPNNPSTTHHHPADFDLRKWDPDSPTAHSSAPTKTSSEHFFNVAQNLSPIARYIVDNFRKHQHWGPPLVQDLNKLRRVTPKLVAEVLKVQSDPKLASKFFHWAGKQKGYKHDFACYNAFAYFLNRNNQFRAADQVPELMNMQGKTPSEKQFEILIRMHSDANRGLRVYYVYEKMKKFGVKPRVFLYNRIMDALVKCEHFDLAMLVYNDFKSDGLVEEGITFMILIKGLCKAGRVDEAVEILGKMRKFCKPDIFAYTAMVRVLVSEGNLEGCLRVWEEMRGDKVEPDVMAYGTIVMGLCKGGMVDKGYEFFNEMKGKGYLIDRSIYGSLIKGYVEDRKVALACDLLKDLMDSGYRADLAIYNSLIEGLCNAKWVDKANKLFRVTVTEDLQPDFTTVNPMLVCYAESKRIDEFYKLLSQMQSLGFKVIDDLSKFFSYMVREENRINTALEMFKDLKKKGYHSVLIYNILMGALEKFGDVNKALTLFQELEKSSIEPDSSSYSIGITCFAQVGDIQKACSCYNKLTEMSLVPSVDAYTFLVEGLCKIWEIDAAMMLIRDCLANVPSGPMVFKYVLAIIHICKSNNVDKVMEVLNEMIQQNCPPNNIIFTAIISGMCKHGTIEKAREVFSRMRECKILTESDMIVYDEVLIDHMKKKTADLVLSGIKFFGLEAKLRAKGSKLLKS